MKTLIILSFFLTFTSLLVTGQRLDTKPYTPGNAMNERNEERKRQDEEYRRNAKHVQTYPVQNKNSNNSGNIKTPNTTGDIKPKKENTNEGENMLKTLERNSLLERIDDVKVAEMVKARLLKERIKEEERQKRISVSLAYYNGDINELKMIYFEKITNYLNASDSKTAIKCHDSLSVCLKKAGLQENGDYYGDLTANAYFSEGNYTEAMKYYTMSVDNIVRSKGTYYAVKQYWEAHQRLPDHKEYLGMIKKLCKVAYDGSDMDKHTEIQAIDRWCEVEMGHFEVAQSMLTETIDYFEQSNKTDNDWFYRTNSYYYRALARYSMGKYNDARHDIDMSLQYQESIGATKTNELLALIKNPPLKSSAYATIPEPLFDAVGKGWTNIERGRNFNFASGIGDSIGIWGNNENGQFGIGNTISNDGVIRLTGQLAWKLVSCELDKAVALKKDGSLWHWGKDPMISESSGIPVQKGISNDWAFLFSGNYHTLLLKNNGTLWAFGANWSGQLGTGPALNNENGDPVQVGSSNKWIKAFCGNECSFALKKDGTLWAWGLNDYGQLGTGNIQNMNSPEQIAKGMGTWKNIACGFNHTLALNDNGTIWAWGDNTQGELGIGDTIAHLLPIQVGIKDDWIAVSAGSGYSLALKKDGSLWAWGDNSHGQLGIDNLTGQTSPLQVGKDKDWKIAYASHVYTPVSISLAIKNDGSIWGWGSRNEWLR